LPARGARRSAIDQISGYADWFIGIFQRTDHLVIVHVGTIDETDTGVLPVVSQKPIGFLQVAIHFPDKFCLEFGHLHLCDYMTIQPGMVQQKVRDIIFQAELVLLIGKTSA
jgi:hypothetical protein